MSQLTELFSNVLGVPEESVTDTLSPENTPSWDSLNSIVLITEIEELYGLRFEFDEAMRVKNFSDAIALISSKGVDPYE